MSETGDLAILASNLTLIDELYERFRTEPSSVDASWRELFSNGATSIPLPAPRQRSPNGATAAAQPAPSAAQGLDIWPLVNAYRVRGHLAATLDPLDMLERPRTTELEPSTYGLSEEHLDRIVAPGGMYGIGPAPLRDILAKLQRTYCRSIGLEFMHISTPVKKKWLAERMETLVDREPLPAKVRCRMLELLIAAEGLERFCHVKYPGTKRFSLEGSESMIALLDLVLTHGARLGAIEAVLGMAHRGRLNVLTQIVERKPRDVFADFEDIEPEATLGGGDVKYHLGYSSDRVDPNGREMHVSLTFNPSHLEAVDPVILGRVRAKQRRHDDWEHRRVLGVLIHGDAAFAGQGLVPETLNLTNLHGYRTGGTVHIIVNNQIGFTASPVEARSTPYCTDIAKMIQCPIFHVNGEDLDAVARVVEMAMEYRATFQSDVVIDMFCYRRFGHNEMDEPSFTQPQMYARIQRKKSPVELYAAQLLQEQVVTQEQVDGIASAVREELEGELEVARQAKKRPAIATMRGVWSNYCGGFDSQCPEVDTGVPLERIHAITERMVELPEGFKPHPKIKRLLTQRAAMGRGERPIDWGMGELLAYGSLIWDRTNVRLTGQDSARGTFSHRHAMLADIETGTEHLLLGRLHHEQGTLRIYDSPLSEAGVMGFEFGYSLDFPDALVIWEAQFGDFANGAQVILDQFLFASEDKWHRLSGLVLLLPHGFEGQGPEHSSARIERFLQACAEDNIQVCQPTTPAQMFHLLRRQIVRPYRKPLIVFTPKSLLRLPEATSDVLELTEGRFQRVLDDATAEPERVEQVLLCTGKIYYELVAERQRREEARVAIVRLEQLYPWDPARLGAVLQRYPKVREVVWVQDEPGNMGAVTFLEGRLRALMDGTPLRLVSRPDSASPATGSHKAHVLEQQLLMQEAFDGDK